MPQFEHIEAIEKRLWSVADNPGFPLEFDNEILLAAASVAVRQALAQHKARGNPVVVWRDGRVVILPPEAIEV